MDSTGHASTLQREPSIESQYIFDSRLRGREIICPDLDSPIKEEDDYDLKSEPDPDDQLIYLYDEDEIKDEPYSPETKTENEDPIDEQDYSCPTETPEDNSSSYIVGSAQANDIDKEPDFSASCSSVTSNKTTNNNAASSVTTTGLASGTADETLNTSPAPVIASLVETPVETPAVSPVAANNSSNDTTNVVAPVLTPVRAPIVTPVSTPFTTSIIPPVPPLVATMPPLIATSNGKSIGANAETILLTDIQQRIAAGSSGAQAKFTNQDVHILALIPGPPPRVDDQDPEEEVQVEVSNKWIESRGENYVNLSILSGFPNPQVTKSISLTREGIQIFIHKLSLKTTHSIWNILGSSNAIEKGQSLTTIANLVEKMKICTGCWDQKCREIWEEGVFGERGFVESGFSPSPVYRTFACQLLIDSESRCDACNECRTEWTNMIRVVNKKRRKQTEIRDLDKINYKFLTKADMENALRETRKEASRYRRQITMLHTEIDGLLGEERGRRGMRFCNDEIIIINDKFT